MIKIEVANKTGKGISAHFVRKIAKNTLEISGRKTRDIVLSVVLVSAKEIRDINRVYRKKNSPTDVLSFRFASRYNRIEGEVVVCPEIVAKNARLHQTGQERELAFVLSHGILHILGFGHGRRMYRLQDEVASRM